MQSLSPPTTYREKFTRLSLPAKAFIIIFGLAFLSPLLGKTGHHNQRANQNQAIRSEIDTVRNNPLDGSVHQVERYLKKRLKDPESFEPIEWSQVIRIPIEAKSPYQYMVQCKYRARNSFGGFVIDEKVFFLDENGVIGRITD